MLTEPVQGEEETSETSSDQSALVDELNSGVRGGKRSKGAKSKGKKKRRNAAAAAAEVAAGGAEAAGSPSQNRESSASAAPSAAETLGSGL